MARKVHFYRMLLFAFPLLHFRQDKDIMLVFSKSQPCTCYRKSIPAAGLLWQPSTSFSHEMLIMFAGLIIVVGLLLLLLHRRQKKNPEPDLFLAAEDNTAGVLDILQKASDQRTRINIVCSRPNMTTRTPSGVFVLMEQNPHVFIALHQDIVDEEWSNAPVDIYFHFIQGNKKVFYHFSTFVQRVHRKGNTALLEIPRPSMLTNNQRREFVRIEPGDGMIEMVTLWTNPGALLPGTAAQLGKPNFAFRPPTAESAKILDISASGVALRLNMEYFQRLNPPLQAGSRVCLLLVVNAMKNDEERLMYWLAAECRHTRPALVGEYQTAGFQFTHWQSMQSVADPIDWKPVETDGDVPPLLRWVARVNVLLSRLSE